MTQFQALAILMPVFLLVFMMVVARWMQYQDRAPENESIRPDPARRER